MKLIEKLMHNAELDIDLLTKNDAAGDVFTIPRVVDFLLIAPDQTKAELASSFINDYSYGVASTDSRDNVHRILVQIEMPTTQHVLRSVSAFMQCLAELYDLEYDGWGCVLKNT